MPTRYVSYIFLLLIVCSCSRTTTRYVETNDISSLEKHYVRQPPKIMIDPGHGGKDSGTRSKSEPATLEKHLNLEAALMLEQYLQHLGYQTLITRGDDTFIPLKSRAAFANANRCSLFVSVHFNAAENTKAEGVEVYFYDEEQSPRTVESKLLAEGVLTQFIINTGAKSRGVKPGNFAVIRETTMPAILVEGGFVTNEGELEKLKNPEYLKRVAYGIAMGIRDFLN